MIRKSKKILSIIICAIMAFTTAFAVMPITSFAALTAPTVTAKNYHATAVKLSWKKISSAKKYVIYRSAKKTSGFKAIKTINGNSTISYVNSGLTCGKTYYYKVTSVSGKTKKNSKVVAIKVVPLKVTGLKVTNPKCKQLKATYSKSTGASGYETYTSSDNKTYKKAATTTALYSTVSVSPAKSLYVKVRAYKTVGKTKVYGAFSSVVKGTSKHNYTSKTTPATCTANGKKTYTCSVCKYSYSTSIPKLGHDYSSVVIAPTETTGGYTTFTCKRCKYTYNGDLTPALSHAFTNDFYKYEFIDGKLYTECISHEDTDWTDTLSIDVSKLDKAYEIAGVAKYNPESQKLTLISDKVKNFELTGTKSQLTVSVDAIENGEIKLNGLNITNAPAATGADDCIRINDKCTKTETVDGVTKKVVPTMSISAKDGTTNSLKVTAAGGNAIECASKLEFKGHGTLNLNTVATSVDCTGKMTIKNITMNITSTTNRGIDTKSILADGVTEEYANIDFEANANVTIKAADDGVRCKNMEFEAIDLAKNPDYKGSVLTITSGADAFQLEGKTGLAMYSGKIVIKAGTPKIKKGKFVGQQTMNGTERILTPIA